MALQTPKLFLPPLEPPMLLHHASAHLNFRISAFSGGNSSSGKKGSAAPAPSSNYVVPLDKSSCITRPLAEILRDLNKRIPDNIINTLDHHSTFIPWYQANRMLSFYAPGNKDLRTNLFEEGEYDAKSIMHNKLFLGRDCKQFKDALQGLVLRIIEGEMSMDARKDERRAYSNMICVQDELEVTTMHHGMEITSWSTRKARPSAQYARPSALNTKHCEPARPSAETIRPSALISEQVAPQRVKQPPQRAYCP